MSEWKDELVDGLLHTHSSDMLSEEHPLAYESIYCDLCGRLIHAANNECMKTWFETKWGNFCQKCFIVILEETDEVLTTHAFKEKLERIKKRIKWKERIRWALKLAG